MPTTNSKSPTNARIGAKNWPSMLLMPVAKYDPAKTLPDFETYGEAKERRRRLKGILKIGNAPARRLAKKLSKCTKEVRCGSGACPVCMRHFRRWYVGQVQRTVFKGATDIIVVCLVPLSLRCQPGGLKNVDIKKAQRQLRQQIIRANLGHHVIAGGLDVSFNENSQGQWDSHWQPHWYLLVNSRKGMFLNKDINRYFPGDEIVLRPTFNRKVNDLPECASYSLKSVFVRRVSFLGRDKNMISMGYPLKNEQLRELSVFLDTHSPFDRMFLRNVRRHGRSLIRIR